MCGIIGYFGQGDNITTTIRSHNVSDATTLDMLCEGLRRLEYRGYDSAGVALWNKKGLTIVKKEGKVKNLEDEINRTGLKDTYQIGIAHTRWATHGEPNDTNAHPQISTDKNITVVHNGIIENYITLKKSLIEQGYEFSSETDTEVIPQLIQYFYEQTKDFELAVQRTLSKLEGAYAFLAIHKDHEMLIGAKHGSPLCLGVGDNNNYMFGSDESPFVGFTKKVIYLSDKNIAIVDRYGHHIRNFNGMNVDKEISEVPYDIEAIGKSGFEHFMLKEIHEQPETIANAFSSRVNHIETLGVDNFPDIPHNLNRVLFLACGTSWHAGLIGQYVIEKKTGIPASCEFASEFKYRKPVLTPNDLVIAISQSGNTADTKEALKLAKNSGCYCAGIVNVVGSEIARLAGKGMYLHAGPEIGVASTKAFTSQVVAINLLNLYLNSSRKYRQTVIDELKKLPEKAKSTIDQIVEPIKTIANELKDYNNALFMGRGVNHPVALEGALKLKEISYIHAEGICAGEMKHGPIALIDKIMPSIFIVSGENSCSHKSLSNIKEVKARKGKVIVISDNSDQIYDIIDKDDHVLKVPKTLEELSPIINVIPMQFLAYYVAKARGCEIDKPRNLAKSVTVE